MSIAHCLRFTVVQRMVLVRLFCGSRATLTWSVLTLVTVTGFVPFSRFSLSWFSNSIPSKLLMIAKSLRNDGTKENGKEQLHFVLNTRGSNSWTERKRLKEPWERNAFWILLTGVEKDRPSRSEKRVNYSSIVELMDAANDRKENSFGLCDPIRIPSASDPPTIRLSPSSQKSDQKLFTIAITSRISSDPTRISYVQ
jgi:hypothetical protein